MVGCGSRSYESSGKEWTESRDLCLRLNDLDVVLTVYFEQEHLASLEYGHRACAWIALEET